MGRVYGAVHQDVGASLEGEWSTLRVKFGTRQGALDVLGACVVALNQVRVVAVHHPDEFGQLCGRVEVEISPEERGLVLDLTDQVGEDARDVVLEKAGFDPGRCLEHCCRS
ncbi:MAG TPA: hypothetical protein VGU24_04045 [Microvirga sp.]|nr:hypothetical protein [Microvirga sp.]